jgi:stage V sporulation protein G
MKVKSLKLRKVFKESSHMKAVGELTLDNGWIIKDLRIIEGDSGLFIAFPIPKKIDSDKFYEVLNNDVRIMIQDEVLNEYEKL